MSDEPFKALEVILQVEDAKIKQLDKLFHLQEEMVEITDNFLLWLIGYCDKHKIPFWKEAQLESYVKISKHLLKELRNTTSNLKDLIESRKLPLKKSNRRSPEDLPEPDFDIHST